VFRLKKINFVSSYPAGDICLEDARKWVNDEYERQQAQQQLHKVADLGSTTPTMGGRTVSVLSAKEARDNNLPRFVVIDCSAFNYVDAMGMATLCDVFEEMQQIRVEVWVVGQWRVM
jgi:hypothetical protein